MPGPAERWVIRVPSTALLSLRLETTTRSTRALPGGGSRFAPDSVELVGVVLGSGRDRRSPPPLRSPSSRTNHRSGSLSERLFLLRCKSLKPREPEVEVRPLERYDQLIPA